MSVEKSACAAVAGRPRTVDLLPLRTPMLLGASLSGGKEISRSPRTKPLKNRRSSPAGIRSKMRVLGPQAGPWPQNCSRGGYRLYPATRSPVWPRSRMCVGSRFGACFPVGRSSSPAVPNAKERRGGGRREAGQRDWFGCWDAEGQEKLGREAWAAQTFFPDHHPHVAPCTMQPPWCLVLRCQRPEWKAGGSKKGTSCKMRH